MVDWQSSRSEGSPEDRHEEIQEDSPALRKI